MNTQAGLRRFRRIWRRKTIQVAAAKLIRFSSGVVAKRAAGHGQEYDVKGGPPNFDGVEDHAGGIQGSQKPGKFGARARNPHADDGAGDVGRPVGGDPGELLGCDADLRDIGQYEFNQVTGNLTFEGIRRITGDDHTTVDHEDSITKRVSFLKIMRGE